jgi:hypothetical protein
VGKRSRKERRAGQLERAVVSADPAALQALVDKSPEGAAQHLIRAMGELPPDEVKAARIEAISLRLAKQLRRAGKPGVAFELAASGRRRSPGFRMEEALAAFALGRDEVAASLAALDPWVFAALDPILKAARAEVAAPAPRGRKAASAPVLTPALRSLHAVARAVGLGIQGQATKSRAALKQVDRAFAGRVYADEIGASLELGEPKRARLALRRLLLVPLFRKDGPLQRAAIEEASAADPALAVGDPSLARTGALSARRVRQALLAAATPGMAMAAIRDAAIELFAPSEQASAALYKGYGLIAERPHEALRHFDQAITLGGDLVEALRGKVVALHTLAHQQGEDSAERQARDAASAAERLARALAHDPLARPLAAAAEKLAIDAFVAARDMRAALSAITRARPLASGALLGELELSEIEAIGYKDAKEAVRRLDLLLAKDPGNVEAWNGKIAFMAHSGDQGAKDKVLQEAAAATRDPALVARARSTRMRHGDLSPFDDLVPGALTPGAVAAELRTAFEQHDGIKLLPKVAPFRAALGPEGRLAVDVVSIALAVLHGEAEEDGLRRLGEVFLLWKGSPREAARVASSALLVGLDAAIPKATLGITDDKVLRAITDALLVAGEVQLAGKFVPRIAASMSRHELTFYKEQTRRRGRVPLAIPGVLDPGQVLREIDAILAPELSLAEILDDDLGEDGLDEGDFDEGLFDEAMADPRRLGDISKLPPGMMGPFFAVILRALGAPPDTIDRLPREKRSAFERELTRIITQPPNAEGHASLVALFAAIGVRIDMGGGAPSPFPSRKSPKKRKHDPSVPF